MKLSTQLLIAASVSSIPIMTDLAATDKLPVLFWMSSALMVSFLLGGLYLWASGDTKEI